MEDAKTCVVSTEVASTQQATTPVSGSSAHATLTHESASTAADEEQKGDVAETTAATDPAGMVEIHACSTPQGSGAASNSASSSHEEKGDAPGRRGDDERRIEVSPWSFRIVVAIIYSWCWANGYDISNVANIQPRIYQQFDEIQFLPWIGLAYASAVFASLTLGRQLSRFMDLRSRAILGQLIFIPGCAISGAAKSMAMLIVGRTITGIGSAVLYLCCYVYIAAVATPTQSARVISGIGVVWSLGVIVGGPIGSGFAEDRHATWRWALYFVIIPTVISLVLTIPFMPRYKVRSDGTSLRGLLRKVDFLGVLLFMASEALFSIAMTFCGPVWAWGSGASIATWVVFGAVFAAFVLQQRLCVLTTPEFRAMPVALVFDRRMLPVWVASVCSGMSYGITMYYTPLFFAFMRGMGPIAQAVRVFPFIFVLIVSLALTGRLLPVVGRYKYVYMAAGAICLAAGAALAATISTTVPDAQVLALTALIGLGLGLHFLHGVSISNAVHPGENDRVDGSLIGNMGMLGGVAIALMTAGSVYQNIGYAKLSHILRGQHLTKAEIQAALAGVSSTQIFPNQDLARESLDAVCTVLARLFYIVAASGAICLICGALMKDEKLDFQSLPNRNEDEESRSSGAE